VRWFNWWTAKAEPSSVPEEGRPLGYWDGSYILSRVITYLERSDSLFSWTGHYAPIDILCKAERDVQDAWEAQYR